MFSNELMDRRKWIGVQVEQVASLKTSRMGDRVLVYKQVDWLLRDLRLRVHARHSRSRLRRSAMTVALP